MALDSRQQQDLILAPGEYVYTLDTTKGTVNVLVGPYQSGLSGNATPVIWENDRFVRKETYSEIIQRFISVQEGDYVEITNPAKDTNREHPNDGTANNLTDLHFGRRVVIPGPAYFALWPRQSHKVISGHQLRSNQYLLVRIYNDQEATDNWNKAVIKNARNSNETGETDLASIAPKNLTTGQLLIIKGTEVSFYIPPTGIEVVPDKSGKYVREAVTLERMEFCILKEERGEKRYVQGPDVVFPSPTETFVEVNGEVKFKPIELNQISGLYIKVIADYTDDDKVEHKKGDELFITGKQQAIYYPRPEHNIIKYGDKTVHYAVAVPKGEGRYVLNRDKGEVRLVKGPIMLLPDPRKEVIVRRVLDDGQVILWYPGNQKAAEINLKLKSDIESGDRSPSFSLESAVSRGVRSPDAFAGDSLNRGTSFNPPRTITLDTKYEGAVGVSPYPGFAILVVNKSGDRRVVEGPASILLEYDETLMPMELSTGTPKTDTRTIKTVYLQVKNNRVSDKIVALETKDLVPVDVTVAYMVNFEGSDPLKWFQVDNYVRHLTEHARSMLRSAVKQVSIEKFYQDPINIIRDALLGKQVEGEGRKGLNFEENSMHVYDVDVLDVKIESSDISYLLENAQTEALRSTLSVAKKEREFETIKRIEEIERKISSEKADTSSAKIALEVKEIKKLLGKSIAGLSSKAKSEEEGLKNKNRLQPLFDEIAKAELAREKTDKDQSLWYAEAQQKQELEKHTKETEEIVARAGAVNEKLIAALQAFGDKALVEKAAEAMAPLAILRNSGVMDTLSNLLQGTALAEVLKKARRE
jgi:major vault protein